MDLSVLNHHTSRDQRSFLMLDFWPMNSSRLLGTAVVSVWAWESGVSVSSARAINNDRMFNLVCASGTTSVPKVTRIQKTKKGNRMDSPFLYAMCPDYFTWSTTALKASG